MLFIAIVVITLVEATLKSTAAEAAADIEAPSRQHHPARNKRSFFIADRN